MNGLRAMSMYMFVNCIHASHQSFYFIILCSTTCFIVHCIPHVRIYIHTDASSLRKCTASRQAGEIRRNCIWVSMRTWHATNHSIEHFQKNVISKNYSIQYTGLRISPLPSPALWLSSLVCYLSVTWGCLAVPRGPEKDPEGQQPRLPSGNVFDSTWSACNRTGSGRSTCCHPAARVSCVGTSEIVQLPQLARLRLGEEKKTRRVPTTMLTIRNCKLQCYTVFKYSKGKRYLLWRSATPLFMLWCFNSSSCCCFLLVL